MLLHSLLFFDLAGALIVDLCAGAMSPTDPRPVASDTLFPGFNFADVLCAIVAGQLEDQGLLRLNGAVAAVWPAFGANGKEGITVADVLQHKAGLAEYPQGPLSYDQLLRDNSVVANVAQARPYRAGTCRYHLLSSGAVIAGLVEHVTRGQSLKQFVRQRIAAPLGLQSELIMGPDNDDPACSRSAMQQQ